MNRSTLPVTSHQIKIFVTSFAITFIIVMLQLISSKAGFHLSLPGLISPVETKTEDALTPLLPHLEQKKNTYKLSKSSRFIGTAQAASDSDQSRAYAVIDYETGKILAEKDGDQSVPIASITKVMTAVVALDLASADEEFTVTENAAAAIPTKIGVVPGQKLTLRELLLAALMTSANDAVQVIKDGIDQKYGSKVFIRAMNAKAKFLGLQKTHFTNPQGFDDTYHYSSAEDLAVLTHYALSNYPLISSIVRKDYTQLPANVNHDQFDLYNWNGLIGVYPNVSGVKIGNTDAAKKTTVVTAEREGKTILVVLLGAPGIFERDLWAAQLLDLGFARTLNLPPIQVTKEQLQAKYDTWQYWQ